MNRSMLPPAQLRMLRSVNAEAEARMLQHFLPKPVIEKLKDGKLPFTEPVPQACQRARFPSQK